MRLVGPTWVIQTTLPISRSFTFITPVKSLLAHKLTYSFQRLGRGHPILPATGNDVQLEETGWLVEVWSGGMEKSTWGSVWALKALSDSIPCNPRTICSHPGPHFNSQGQDYIMWVITEHSLLVRCYSAGLCFADTALFFFFFFNKLKVCGNLV